MSDSSLSTSRRIDAICGRFETDWQSGQRPSIEALVAAAESVDQSQLLAELITLEFELRISAGQPARLEDYLERFPGDESVVRAALASFRESAATAGDPSGTAQHALRPGEPRYLLGEQIGQGGMGVIISARDQQLDRELAVKLLAEPLQTHREARERFLREARICARLQHPGILPIHELGWLDGRPYFAMKLVRGQSLADALKSRPDPGRDLPKLLEFYARVCETVAYAHAQGVVHRDLKPANVMLGSFGEVYVIDWGLAKDEVPVHSDGNVPDAEFPGNRNAPAPRGDPGGSDAHAGEPLLAEASIAWTFLGDVVGTPQYMSPEQAVGDTDAIDQRSDVFALGAMLCEILTGEAPYSGGDHHTRLQRAQRGDLAETMARLETCNADRELIVLARDCLAVQPGDRPDDGGQVLQRLTAFLRGVQERLRRIELEQAEARARAEEQRRRRRIVLTLVAGLTFLALTLVAGTAWFARHEAARQRDEALRRTEIERQLRETLDEVAQLYAQAPEDWRNDPLRRTRIRELAQRAATLAEHPFIPAAPVQQVAELRERIAAEDADDRLLDRLEEIRLIGAEANPRINQFANGRTRPMYYQAFADYGVDSRVIDAEQAIAKIRSRPNHVVEACVFGLESWWLLFKREVPLRTWIGAVLDGIDDNPWRCAVRQACRKRDWPAVNQMLATAETEQLSPEVVHLVTAKLMNARQLDLALELLLEAQPRYPGDFWINQYLALVHYCRTQPDLNESARYFTAALAIRETGAAYLNLGVALWSLHRYPEAEHAFRSALRLQPDYARAHFCLASVLKDQNRIDEALASVEQALAANPEMAEAAALRDQLQSER